MRRQTLFLLFMILFSLPLTVLAQGTKIVKGTVVDQNNEPIIGATVVVKGSTIGAATDLDGNYVLNGVPEDATLVFNYLGMLPQEISAAGQSVINVKLREDAQLLEEVVVIGYGSAKAKDLTAPIDVVKEKELINVPTSSPMAALQGKVPGVNIINSGTPGEGPKVTIRGMGSFGDTSPLYVVDGMFYDNINFLNNSDIQDMTILKDASASAIYGVRAANGVVIITTKKGSRNQDAKITYNGYVGIQKATNLLEMCNSHEYATMMLEANPEAYRSIFEKSVAEFGGNMENLQFNADTNWYDELLRTAMMTNHSLNISGGTEKATYSAGMSYLAQDGIMDVENYYRRLNFRAALDYEARKWLKVGFNGVFSNSQQQLPKNAAWQQAYNTPSIIPVYDDRRDDAVFPKKYTSPEQVGLTNNFNNPVATANYYDNRNETYQVLTNFYAQLNLIPDKLNIRSSYSYDYSMIRGSEFTPTYYVGTNQKKEVTELTKKNTNYYKYIWDNVATYTDKWGKHSFTGMLGASMRQEQYRLLEGTATNVPEGEDVWKYIALGNKEGATVKDDGWKYRGLSYFTRLNYNYNDKYMLMFTFRADGSSKYNDKWGYFPSIGAAWVISQEPFMKNQNIFDYMKLRASWGKLGNDKIAASAGFASIQNVQSVFGPNTAIDGFINTTNFSWLGWEVVNETNVGVNFSTLKNRLNADIDWYYRLTDNAVISPKLPMSGELLAGNNGQILNTGIDLSLNWNDKISDFEYNVGFNISTIANKVVALANEDQTIYGVGLKYGSEHFPTQTKVGKPIGAFYLYQADGIFQSLEEVQAHKNSKGELLQPNAQPGDVRFKDMNGDGVIDEDDKTYSGTGIAKVEANLNLGASYKGFDFSAVIGSAFGNKLYNGIRYYYEGMNSASNFLKTTLNAWTPTNTKTDIPRAVFGDPNQNTRESTRFLENGDFVRLRQVQLGYTLPKALSKHIYCESIRFYVSAENVFTITGYSGANPEFSMGVLNSGIDRFTYPFSRSYTVGAQVSF